MNSRSSPLHVKQRESILLSRLDFTVIKIYMLPRNLKF
jgi:hypothetical protein